MGFSAGTSRIRRASMTMHSPRMRRQRAKATLLLTVLAAAVTCISCGGSGGGGGGGIPPFSLYWSVAVADLNSDGLPDVITSYTFFSSPTSQPGSVAVYLQDPSRPGTFLPPVT